MKLSCTPGKTYWGLALAWYGDYTQGGVADVYESRMNFLEKYGMKCFMGTPEEIDNLPEKRREKLFEQLETRDMHIILHSDISHADADEETMKRKTDEQVNLLSKYIRPCRSDIVTCCANNHRYDRMFPWEERVRRFSRIMAPVAQLCWEQSSVFSIENHADYYVSDLLDVLRETPRLYLFLDTANALRIGERPIQACIDAAPYVVGTHFKDHRMVRGEKPPLHYEIRGCALGDGDADLELQYKEIMARSPFRDRLVMMFELFAPEDGSLAPMDCFEKSVAFVQRLQEG